jgi:hypothetical protein
MSTQAANQLMGRHVACNINDGVVEKFHLPGVNLFSDSGRCLCAKRTDGPPAHPDHAGSMTLSMLPAGSKPTLFCFDCFASRFKPLKSKQEQES